MTQSMTLTAAQAAQQNNRDGGGKYAIKTVDESDVDLDGAQHHALYDAAAHQAATIAEAGAREQVRFLRNRGVSDDLIRDAAECDALDDLVLDAAEQLAANAYNDSRTPDDLDNDFEFARWSTNSSQYKTHVPGQGVLSMEPGTTTDLTFEFADGEVTFRVGYSEEIARGDDGFRALGYRRGEYYVSSEFGEAFDDLPASFVTSPFREGADADARRYAWQDHQSRIVEAARRAVQARQSDPLRDFYED